MLWPDPEMLNSVRRQVSTTRVKWAHEDTDLFLQKTLLNGCSCKTANLLQGQLILHVLHFLFLAVDELFLVRALRCDFEDHRSFIEADQCF